MHTLADLHALCTRALLSAMEWKSDGYYFYGELVSGPYRISTYGDNYHKQRDSIGKLQLLEQGQSILFLDITGSADCLLAHPRNLMTEGTWIERSPLEQIISLLGKNPDPDMLVALSTVNLPHLLEPSEPWLQEIYKDLQARL